MPRLDRAGVLDAYRTHVNRGMAMVSEIADVPVESHASGAYIFDVDGNRYLQCGGYGVFLLGLCHPDVVAAVQRQVQTLPLSSRELLSEETAAASATLAAVAPEGMDYVYFGNSGAEAAETAIKLARLNGKTRLISTVRGYHGKTLGALSVTGQRRYREPFEPLLEGVRFVPFGDADAMADELGQTAGDACVIVEPIQGEGGVRIPPPGYLQDIERLCREAGAFLVFDEIFTGLGRTGEWWASSGVVPDVLLTGKTLSGGVVPVSAAIASEAAFGVLNRDPVLHSSTFSGAPLGAVAARTAIEVIQRDGIVERARELGERLLGELTQALDGRSTVVDVRGRGLLIGVEFADPGLAGEFMLEMLRRGVLVAHSSSSHEVVRFTPPAILDDADVRWLIEAAADAAKAADPQRPAAATAGRS